MILRPATEADARDIRAIFQAAVAGTGAQYTEAQRTAWAAGLVGLSRWTAILREEKVMLALLHGRPLGFMTLRGGDYVNFAYVHPDAARRGMGRALHDAITGIALTRGTTRLTTHASLAAQPFFAALGWQTLTEETVTRAGQTLRRFHMQRDL